MPIHTRFIVACPCGHTGNVRLSESDEPQESSQQRYTLENLNGTSTFATETAADWNTVFRALQPSCPKCGQRLAPGHRRD